MERPSTLAPSLFELLSISKRVYGCLSELTDVDLLENLRQASCLLIITQKERPPEQEQQLNQLYSQLFPVDSIHLVKLHPQLRKRERTLDKAVHALPVFISHNFLIFEQEKRTVLWIITSSLDKGIYHAEPEVMAEFRSQFLTLLCQTNHYYLEDEIASWQVINNNAESTDSAAPSGIGAFLQNPSVRWAGRALYYGITTALEIKYPHIALLRRTVERFI
jgi:hypothetical protein